MTQIDSGRTMTTVIVGTPLPWMPVVDDAQWENAAITMFGELAAASENDIDPERTAHELRAAARDLETGQRIIASLALEQRWPQLFIVEAGEPADDVDPAVLAGAAEPGPFGLPEVERDGTGVAIATRRDLLDDGSVSITVCVVRRTPGLDVRVLWRTTELDLVEIVRSELVALSSAVHVEDAS
ncbi:hypothetical protein [Curtobacterium flaccumfaciens]|uniref:hypothetical protein n=1 Tax=Curtobacterium flaccumfaciens TaxID=2035 RepID=UPI00112CFA6F|nr:hypothetical protein [Curtobacterium flaccumfaciens]TPG03977.1 hypothetical protein EAH85_17950 [Curtobacterium flaccumfaciens]